MKNFRTEAIILAVGMLLLGVFIERGFSTFAEKDRIVNVKGLAEMEVPADKVTWPLVYKSLGNDLNSLYDEIKKSNQTIVQFLKQKGLEEKEISISAPHSHTLPLSPVLGPWAAGTPDTASITAVAFSVRFSVRLIPISF